MGSLRLVGLMLVLGCGGCASYWRSATQGRFVGLDLREPSLSQLKESAWDPQRYLKNSARPKGVLGANVLVDDDQSFLGLAIEVKQLPTEAPRITVAGEPSYYCDDFGWVFESGVDGWWVVPQGENGYKLLSTTPRYFTHVSHTIEGHLYCQPTATELAILEKSRVDLFHRGGFANNMRDHGTQTHARVNALFRPITVDLSTFVALAGASIPEPARTELMARARSWFQSNWKTLNLYAQYAIAEPAGYLGIDCTELRAHLRTELPRRARIAAEQGQPATAAALAIGLRALDDPSLDSLRREQIAKIVGDVLPHLTDPALAKAAEPAYGQMFASSFVSEDGPLRPSTNGPTMTITPGPWKYKLKQTVTEWIQNVQVGEAEATIENPAHRAWRAEVDALSSRLAEYEAAVKIANTSAVTTRGPTSVTGITHYHGGGMQVHTQGGYSTGTYKSGAEPLIARRDELKDTLSRLKSSEPPKTTQAMGAIYGQTRTRKQMWDASPERVLVGESNGAKYETKQSTTFTASFLRVSSNDTGKLLSDDWKTEEKASRLVEEEATKQDLSPYLRYVIGGVAEALLERRKASALKAEQVFLDMLFKSTLDELSEVMLRASQ